MLGWLAFSASLKVSAARPRKILIFPALPYGPPGRFLGEGPGPLAKPTRRPGRGPSPPTANGPANGLFAHSGRQRGSDGLISVEGKWRRYPHGQLPHQMPHHVRLQAKRSPFVDSAL
jgi:hypothetical protein